jgi:catalase
MRSFLYFSTLLGTAVAAGCPYMSGELSARGEDLGKRQVAASVEEATMSTQEFLAPFKLNDTGVYMTTDSGTPIDESVSLKAGVRGPTLLEDFIFRQKLQRFDHERVSIHLPLISTLQINVYMLTSITRFQNAQCMHEALVSHFVSRLWPKC